MFKSFVLLLCSLFAIAFIFVPAPAHHEKKAAPPISILMPYQKRQDNGTSMSMTSDMQTLGNTLNPDSSTTVTATTSYVLPTTTLIGSVNPSSSMPTTTSVYTTTIYSTTLTSTIMTTSTSGSQSATPTVITVTTTVTASASTSTVYQTATSITTTTVTVTVGASSDTTTTTSSCPSPTTPTTALTCSDLSASLNGQPYTAPMCTQYNLQCQSYYYTDDDNTLATYYGVASFRACADLCDMQDGCNLFFLGTEAAGDQAQECFLLSSDEYGQAVNSTIADAGVRVGYVSEQLPPDSEST